MLSTHRENHVVVIEIPMYARVKAGARVRARIRVSLGHLSHDLYNE